MIARRLFACTLAASTAAAGTQVALCESNVPQPSAAAVASSTARIRDAVLTYGPEASPRTAGPRGPSIHERSRQFGSVI